MGEESRNANQGQLLSALGSSKQNPLNDWELEREYMGEKVKQDLRFRGYLFWIVCGLMIGEVLAMFAIVFLQGFGTCGFKLDQWVLAAFEAGILLQTFGLAKIITKALFRED